MEFQMSDTIFLLNHVQQFYILFLLEVKKLSMEMESHGLDDFKSNSDSFFGTNNVFVNAEEEVDQGSMNVEFNPEGGSLQSQTPIRKKELTSAERQAAYQCLLERMVDGVLKREATKVVAAMFGVGIRSVQRLWKRGRESGTHDYHTRRLGNCGRKRVEIDLERIRNIPLRSRTTLRSISSTLGVSQRSIKNTLKNGSMRRHSNAIKPLLTQDNMNSRMRHCLANIDPTSIPHQPAFKMMHNTIHIDEKWFYLSKKSQNYYLLRDEIDPVRTLKNANFIPKVMFLAAVARPTFDSCGNCTFDGKIGVFPFVEDVAAVRSSQNRPRGTIETKAITNISRCVIRDFMIGKVLPAIVNKWPSDRILERIFIQQDNAKTYINTDDVEFMCAVECSGLNLSVVCQSPNSPDMNVLDLGFFRAIQSLQSKECAKSTTELIGAVETAYQNFSVKKSNYIFLTLQTCMLEVLKCDGSNAYKIPHMSKEALERAGNLPPTILCPPEVYANALHLLSP